MSSCPVVMVGLYGAQRQPNLSAFEPIPKLDNAKYWTLNDCWSLSGVKWDRIFQIHKNFEALAADRPSCYRNWKPQYNDTGAEIVIGDEFISGLKRQKAYPWKEAIAEFGLDYFQSSFNCMIALAILEGHKEIYLRRVRLDSSDEYDAQAKGILYAIHEAEKRGVYIDAPWRLDWESRIPKDEPIILPKLKDVYGPYVHKKTVAFVGLYTPDLQFVTQDDLRWGGADIWSLNDCYRVFNFAPERIYNPADNTFEGHPEEAERFKDWKSEYNRLGSEIVTMDTISGLNRQRTFDFKRGVKDFGLSFFTSTMSYMFAEAIWEGYEVIKLYGIRLGTDGEYGLQLPGVLRAIDECRARGIQVDAPYEDIWRENPISIDWANITKAIVPYSHTSCATFKPAMDKAINDYMKITGLTSVPK